MPQIDGEIFIDRPVEVVFDIVADERYEPHYNTIMLDVVQITPGPIGVGTQFRAKAKGLGQSVEMTTEITTFDRPTRIELRTHMSTLEIQGCQTFEPIDGGTRMHWHWDLAPSGFYRLMGPIIAKLGAAQEIRVWTALKHYLEDAHMS